MENTKKEQEVANETNKILANQYILKLNKKTSESYFDMLLLENTPINIDNINSDLKKLRLQFTDKKYVFEFPYQEMLYMLYKAITEHYDYKIKNNNEYNENSQNIIIIYDKNKQTKEHCKSILQYLILFDAEYYIYNNNKFTLNLLTITENNINSSMNNIINGIKQHMWKVQFSNTVNSMNILNEISNEILEQDTDKIKLFYKAYYHIMDHYCDNMNFNSVSKKFDNIFDYYNWFNHDCYKQSKPYHDHKSLLEWTMKNLKNK